MGLWDPRTLDEPDDAAEGEEWAAEYWQSQAQSVRERFKLFSLLLQPGSELAAELEKLELLSSNSCLAQLVLEGGVLNDASQLMNLMSQFEKKAADSMQELTKRLSDKLGAAGVLACKTLADEVLVSCCNCSEGRMMIWDQLCMRVPKPLHA